MAAIDRRTFLRGIAYAVLGRVLGWEITEIADADAAPGEEPTLDYVHYDPCWNCAVPRGDSCMTCTAVIEPTFETAPWPPTGPIVHFDEDVGRYTVTAAGHGWWRIQAWTKGEQDDE